MHEPAKILIVDDEPHIRRILQFLLEQAGYQVVVAADGRQALDLMAAQRPDLVLLDVMMPHLDGFAVLESLRKDRDGQCTPVIMLTARGESADRVRGLRVGANDYLGKPFDRDELLARVANLLDAFRSQREANPLTGLPGNHAIERELGARLASGEPFAAMYIDIDRFKSFNDHYGYARGDRAIDLLSQVLCQAVDAVDADRGFVGHVGGDDFVVLCGSGVAEELATRVLRTFEVGVEHLHDPVDWQRGFLATRTRTGETVEAGLITLTIALIEDVQQHSDHPAALSDALAELKRHGKQQPGSVLVKERRTAEATSALIGASEQPRDNDP